MNKVYLLLILCGIVDKGILAETGTYEATLKRTDWSVELKCKKGTTISVQSVTGEDESNECGQDFCKSSRLLEEVKYKCDGHDSCEVIYDLLGYCSQSPIYIDLKYKCFHNMYDWSWQERTVCANALDRVRCFGRYEVFISRVNLKDRHNYDRQHFVKKEIKHLCDERRVCQKVTAAYVESFLFEANDVTIRYKCKDYPKTIPNFNITDGRVLVSYNGTVRTLCDKEWDDNDATVLCRYLNFSNGIATSQNNLTGITSEPVALYCLGNEASLDECDIKRMDHTCTSDQVAGAKCCAGALEDCKSQEINKQYQQKDHSGIGTFAFAGLTIAGIQVLVVAMVCLLRKRFSNKNRDKKHSNFADHASQRNVDFTGTYCTQGIIQLKANYRALKTLIYSLVNDACRADTTIENGSDGYSVLKKENPSTNLNSDGGNNGIAASNVADHNSKDPKPIIGKKIGNSQEADNVYDQTANTKWKTSAEAVYSHSVNGIYDKNSYLKHNNISDNLFSHSVDDINDKTSDTKHVRDNDNVYNHFVD